jgi:hypothetical protein
MGRANASGLGAFTGTIGPVTGYVRNGHNLLRSSTSSARVTRTPLQLAQREKIRICNAFNSAFSYYRLVSHHRKK